ncbi:MAG: hypothetical protein PHV17_08665, partial [Candidatus Omnitrophica bacterium]|nr:hypothetical protein [Candidatus Omnitrophota bacterium]
MRIDALLDKMIERDISDLFIRINSQVRGRINTEVEQVTDEILSHDDVIHLIKQMAKDEEQTKLQKNKACEFTYWYKDFWRFRVGVFYQRNTPALVIRK